MKKSVLFFLFFHTVLPAEKVSLYPIQSLCYPGSNSLVLVGSNKTVVSRTKEKVTLADIIKKTVPNKPTYLFLKLTASRYNSQLAVVLSLPGQTRFENALVSAFIKIQKDQHNKVSISNLTKELENGTENPYRYSRYLRQEAVYEKIIQNNQNKPLKRLQSIKPRKK